MWVDPIKVNIETQRKPDDVFEYIRAFTHGPEAGRCRRGRARADRHRSGWDAHPPGIVTGDDQYILIAGGLMLLVTAARAWRRSWLSLVLV